MEKASTPDDNFISHTLPYLLLFFFFWYTHPLPHLSLTNATHDICFVRQALNTPIAFPPQFLSYAMISNYLIFQGSLWRQGVVELFAAEYFLFFFLILVLALSTPFIGDVSSHRTTSHSSLSCHFFQKEILLSRIVHGLE